MGKEIKTYPLTGSQQSIAIIQQFYPESVYNNLGLTIRIKEKLDYKLLNNAINQVIKRYDALRIRLEKGETEPVQYFEEYKEKSFEFFDFSYENGNKDYLSWANQANQIVMPLFDSELVYFAILKFGSEEGGVYIKCHHLIADFWGITLLVEKILEDYHILRKSQEIDSQTALSYSDYILKEQKYLASPRYLKDKDFWRTITDKIIDPNIFKRRKTNSLAAIRKRCPIPEDISVSLDKLCKELKISPFIVFCSVLAIYFAKKNERDSIVIGTTVFNRATLKEKNTIGNFFNNLPFLIELKPSLSFTDFLNYLNQEWLELLRHSSYPYVKILKDYREKHKVKTELFDFTLTYLNSSFRSENIRFDMEHFFNGEEVNTLRINVNDFYNDGIFYLDYDYSTEILSDQDVIDVNNCILNLLRYGFANPKERILDLHMLSDSEEDLIINKFNRTSMDYDYRTTILQLFQEQVAKNPEKCALIFENRELTYKELNQKTNQLANYLVGKSVEKEEIIGLSVNRSFFLIIGIIAILKAGAAYLPIDPDYPKERTDYMLKDSGCRYLLSNFPIIDNIEVENIDLNNSEIWNQPADDFEYTCNPTDLAYVIYTSGSTGFPKGVMIEHKALNNFVNSMIREIGTDFNTVLSITTLSFDIFFVEAVFPILIGKKIIILNDEEQLNPALLSDILNKYEVDLMQTTPSRISALVKSDNLNLEKLSFLLIGGEAFPEQLLSTLKKKTNAKILNMYGPTETTIWSSVKLLADSGSITIGRPIGNTQFYILDNNYLPVPIGFIGEIFIAGDGIARGYLNKPELTKERFVANPFIPGTKMYKTGDLGKWLENGEIIFIGRNDHQVKIRGFRIELEEIEKCLVKNNHIEQAVVMSVRGPSNRNYLCAYLKGTQNISLLELSNYLSEYLPDYMIPSQIVWLSNFPLTPNGKVDRNALPQPDQIRQSKVPENNFVLPRDSLEQTLAAIWSKVLGIKQIGIDDDFFGLGGDSLAILEILSTSLLNDWKISAQEFYEYPTIRKLAGIIKNKSQESDSIKDNSYQNMSHPKMSTEYLTEGPVNTDNMLLTGATGFLGIHILAELLKSNVNTIYCLVRGKDYQRRFSFLLNFYFPELASEFIGKKIIILNGDICEERLGLSEEEYDLLSQEVSSVIHSAALVKHFGMYSEFEKINVKGTQKVIDFCLRYQKHLSFISTISVSGNYMPENKLLTGFSEDDLYIGQDYQSNVYIRSKFEAETLVLNAVEAGLKAVIFRIGILTGRFSDGVFQHNINENAFYRRLKSILALQALPENVLEDNMEFTPVDYCARAIVSILKANKDKQLVYHLFNHNNICIRDFINFLKLNNYEIRIQSPQEFRKLIADLSQNNKGKEIITGIVNDVISNKDLNYSHSVEVSSSKTIEYLNNIGFEWPEVTEDYFRKIIAYMIKVGYIQGSENTG